MRGNRDVGGAILFILLLFAQPLRSWAVESTGHESLSEIRKEIHGLEADRSRDLQLMEKLERRVDQLEKENSQLKAANAQIKSTASEATQQVKTLQAQVEAGPSPKT